MRVLLVLLILLLLAPAGATPPPTLVPGTPPDVQLDRLLPTLTLEPWPGPLPLPPAGKVRVETPALMPST